MNVRDVNWNNMRVVARYIHEWANATFPTRKTHASLQKLVLEEIPELLMHKKQHGTEHIGTELADCFILLMDLAMIWKVDLPRALMEKMEINEHRMWKKDPEGDYWNHASPVVHVDQTGADQTRDGVALFNVAHPGDPFAESDSEGGHND